MVVDGGLKPEDLRQISGRPSKHSESDLLALLPEAGLTCKEWKAAAADDCDMGKTVFYRLMDRLRDSGRVLDSKVSGKWMPVLERKT